MSKNRKNVWIFVGVGVVIVAAVVLIVASLRSQNGSSQASYQTATVQRGTLTATVEGSGTVAANQSNVLTWQTGGQVEKVNVQIGQKVMAGEVLASLSSSSLMPNILQAQVDVVKAQRNLDDLLHSGTAAANAQLALANAQKSYNSAQAKADQLKLPRADSSTVDYYWSQYLLALQSVQRAQDAYNATAGLSDSDPKRASAYTSLYNAEVARDQALGSYNYVTGKPTNTDAAITLANLAVAKAALDTAQATWDRLKNGPDANDVKAAQATLQSAQNTANEQFLIAPFSGTITQVNINAGDVISAGTKAIRVDTLSNMVVTVQITEIDVNSVKVDQPATIVFDAIPNKTYNGKIIRADMAGTAGQNSVNFNVTVALLDADALVKPGMAANVTIISNQVADALLVPSTAIFTDNNGQQYVYLIQNGIPTVVNVTVGAISSTSSQITSDNLKEGDIIILSFASTSSNDFQGGFGPMTGGAGRVEVIGEPPSTNP